jgi:dsRNA-specific ribonuclease
VLNEVGRKIGLDSVLKFEMSTYYQPSDAIVTTGIRAVIGAVHERAGYDIVRGLVEELFVTYEMLKRAREYQDPISELKRWLEGSPWKPKIMAYDAVVDGKKVFYHSIEYCDMNVIGTGPSRMKAEAQASRIMLGKMSIKR